LYVKSAIGTTVDRYHKGYAVRNRSALGALPSALGFFLPQELRTRTDRFFLLPDEFLACEQLFRFASQVDKSRISLTDRHWHVRGQGNEDNFFFFGGNCNLSGKKLSNTRKNSPIGESSNLLGHGDGFTEGRKRGYLREDVGSSLLWRL